MQKNNVRTLNSGIEERERQFYLIKQLNFPVEVLYQRGLFGNEMVRKSKPLCYIMTCMDYFKVGMSVCPHQRRNTLMAQVPFDVVIHRIYRVREPIRAADLERSLHKALAEHRYRGEWFHISALDLIEHRPVCTIDIEFDAHEVMRGTEPFQALILDASTEQENQRKTTKC